MRAPHNGMSCVLAGSFRYKTAVDEIRRQFEGWGVSVLEPAAGSVQKGSLYIPNDAEVKAYGDHTKPVWPLPNEFGLSIRQIERRFLAALARASFMYVVTNDGYYGLSVAFEMGHAYELEKPIYADHPLQVPDDDPHGLAAAVIASVQILNVRETVEHMGARLHSQELWLYPPQSTQAFG